MVHTKYLKGSDLYELVLYYYYYATFLDQTSDL